jgi:segregation and condensation protein B
LSQEALETLALVAYRQPISRRKIEEVGKRNAGSHLRQLLERQLIMLDDSEKSDESEPQYRTTPRFLDLFGVRRVQDLPQIENLNYK